VTISEGGARRSTVATSYEDLLSHPLASADYGARACRDCRRSRSPCCRQRTGEGRASTPAATSKGSCRAGLAREVARGARHRALDALLHGTMGSACRSAFFGHFLKGEDTGWTRQPPVVLRCAIRESASSSGPRREWPLGRHALDEALPEPGRGEPRHEPLAGDASVSYAGFGRRGHVC